MELKPGYKQTEVGVIPEDWDVVPITSLLQPGSGITYGVVQPGPVVVDGVLFIRGGDIYDGSIAEDNLRTISVKVSRQYERTILRGGELLVSLVGYPGEAAIVPPHLAGGNIARQVAIARLDRSNDEVASYVCWFLRSDTGKKLLLKEAIGSAQKVINLRDISRVSLPVPQKEERLKVVSLLDDIDALLDSHEQLLDKKRNIKQAAMQELLTGKRRLPGFEGEWDEVQLGDIAAIRNVKAVASSMPAETQCIELECIEQGSGRLLMSNHPTGESTKYTFKKGDVLFGRLRAYLRKFWLASFDGVCSTEIWPLIARDERLSAGFLHLLVQTNDFIDAACISYGTHMPRSDWGVLGKFQLKLPPRPEQDAIATVMADIDAELSDLVQRSQKAACLKQGMMQQLLTGKIRLT